MQAKSKTVNTPLGDTSRGKGLNGIDVNYHAEAS
jgi:hypothetical protein